MLLYSPSRGKGVYSQLVGLITLPPFLFLRQLYLYLLSLYIYTLPISKTLIASYYFLRDCVQEGSFLRRVAFKDILASPLGSRYTQVPQVARYIQVPYRYISKYIPNGCMPSYQLEIFFYIIIYQEAAVIDQSITNYRQIDSDN